MSSIWSKLLTAIRGGATEVGEAVVDSQSLRILDQEIRDSDNELRKAKDALTDIMAKEKLAKIRVSENETKIAELEDKALKAIAASRQDLALEVAERIASLQVQLDAERTQASNFTTSVEKLRKTIVATETRIKQLKQQVDIVKATESVQQAQLSVAKSSGGSQAKLQTAVDSLERIKQRQAERDAKMEAQDELAAVSSGDDLEKKLRDAGIVPDSGSAQAVLDRLLNQPKP